MESVHTALGHHQRTGLRNDERLWVVVRWPGVSTQAGAERWTDRSHNDWNLLFHWRQAKPIPPIRLVGPAQPAQPMGKPGDVLFRPQTFVAAKLIDEVE